MVIRAQELLSEGKPSFPLTNQEEHNGYAETVHEAKTVGLHRPESTFMTALSFLAISEPTPSTLPNRKQDSVNTLFIQ